MVIGNLPRELLGEILRRAAADKMGNVTVMGLAHTASLRAVSRDLMLGSKEVRSNYDADIKYHEIDRNVPISFSGGVFFGKGGDGYSADDGYGADEGDGRNYLAVIRDPDTSRVFVVSIRNTKRCKVGSTSDSKWWMVDRIYSVASMAKVFAMQDVQHSWPWSRNPWASVTVPNALCNYFPTNKRFPWGHSPSFISTWSHRAFRTYSVPTDGHSMGTENVGDFFTLMKDADSLKQWKYHPDLLMVTHVLPTADKLGGGKHELKYAELSQRECWTGMSGNDPLKFAGTVCEPNVSVHPLCIAMGIHVDGNAARTCKWFRSVYNHGDPSLPTSYDGKTQVSTLVKMCALSAACERRDYVLKVHPAKIQRAAAIRANGRLPRCAEDLTNDDGQVAPNGSDVETWLKSGIAVDSKRTLLLDARFDVYGTGKPSMHGERAEELDPEYLDPKKRRKLTSPSPSPKPKPKPKPAAPKPKPKPVAPKLPTPKLPTAKPPAPKPPAPKYQKSAMLLSIEASIARHKKIAQATRRLAQ